MKKIESFRRGISSRLPSNSAQLFQDDRFLIVLLFLANLFLVFAVFLPNLSEINPWDEAAYASSGQQLVDKGELPNLAGNPLTAVFYAISYLPFRNSIQWMVHSVSLGRLVLFSMLWLTTYKVVRELEKFTPVFVGLGILFVTPLAIEMLRFPTDPLFASFAGLALWQLLKYTKTREPAQLRNVSTFLGLSALARNDGLVLFLIFAVISVPLIIRSSRWVRSLAAAALPFIILVGGYIFLVGLLSGNFESGLAKRTYSNFESGQQIVFVGSGELNAVIESRLEARRLFGTPAENANSVFKAILHNPQAYLERLGAVIKALPQTMLKAYGIRFSAVLLMLVLRGIFELIRRREFLILTILMLWPLHLLTGFVITIFRTGHLQFPFYIVFGLASIGLAALVKNIKNRREMAIASLYLIALILYGLFDNKLAIFYGAAVFLGGLMILRLSRQYSTTSMPAIYLLIFITGIIVRGQFPSPIIRTIGIDPKEQMVAYITQEFDKGTFIASGAPGVIWASKMDYAGLISTDFPVNRNSEELYVWMREQGIEAIYVDHGLYNAAPKIWDLIEDQIGSGWVRIFIVDQGNYQVLVPANRN